MTITTTKERTDMVDHYGPGRFFGRPPDRARRTTTTGLPQWQALVRSVSANGGSSIVSVDCAYGWYRGPDGQCYVVGTQPRHRGWYQGQHNYEGYPSPFRAYPYYGGYRYYGRPYENDQGDDDQ
jgi:hypothetical protein